jgi:hypothetical protein
MKLLFVNHVQQICGVYQYGKRVFEILETDQSYDFYYVEVDNIDSFLSKVDFFSPDVIIYNWHELTMPWLTNEITHQLRNKKQVFFYHEFWTPNNLLYDALIMCDLTENIELKMFSIGRPIYQKKLEKPKNEVFKIGSFGFGFQNKGFEKVCEIVNSNFDKAIIHLHITSSAFCDIDGHESKRVIENCKKINLKENIDLVITKDFLTNDEILEFLNGNDLNIFFYDYMMGRGLSSVIDYAISVDSFLVINNSYMFRHLLLEKPEISIENNTIEKILEQGIEPIMYFRNKWSHENMRTKFKEILKFLYKN